MSIYSKKIAQTSAIYAIFCFGSAFASSFFSKCLVSSPNHLWMSHGLRKEIGRCTNHFLETAPTHTKILFFACWFIAIVFLFLAMRTYRKYRNTPEGVEEMTNPKKASSEQTKRMYLLIFSSVAVLAGIIYLLF